MVVLFVGVDVRWLVGAVIVLFFLIFFHPCDGYLGGRIGLIKHMYEAFECFF